MKTKEKLDIFFECEPKITRLISKKIKDRNTVEDLRQEVFLKYENISSRLQHEDNLCGYLLRITNNVIIDYYREQKKEQNYIKDIFIFQEKEFNTDKEINNPLADNLYFFINLLPLQYRDILISVDIEGIPQKKLAESLNLSYSGVKSRVQRARVMLKYAILNCCNYQFDKFGNAVSCCGSEFQ